MSADNLTKGETLAKQIIAAAGDDQAVAALLAGARRDAHHETVSVFAAALIHISVVVLPTLSESVGELNSKGIIFATEGKSTLLSTLQALMQTYLAEGAGQ